MRTRTVTLRSPRWRTRRLTVLALLALAGLAAGFVDAVVGGGGLVQLPALLLGLPGCDAGADAGDQQAGRRLRHHGQQRDVLPPGPPGPARRSCR